MCVTSCTQRESLRSWQEGLTATTTKRSLVPRIYPYRSKPWHWSWHQDELWRARLSNSDAVLDEQSASIRSLACKDAKECVVFTAASSLRHCSFIRAAPVGTSVSPERALVLLARSKVTRR